MLPFVLGCATAAGAWALLKAARLLALGAAYKAKVLASALWVSGLELDVERAPEVSAESYRPMRLLRARVDRTRRSVAVSLFGLLESRASIVPGFGASLHAAPSPGPFPPPRRSAEPRVRRAAALETAVESAFGEPDPSKPRRTRAVAVLKDGELAAERYAAGIGPDTPLNGWSMAKSALGLLLGPLVGDGRLALEKRGLLREWSAAGDRRAGISLEDLLRMRGGLRFSERYDDPRSDVSRMLFLERDAAGYAAARPLANAPGAVWQYSSGTSNLLSLIARRALGEDEYAAWPRRALFEPLGMETAVFERDAAGTFVASSFLFASARDWARLGELLRLGGEAGGRRLLPAGWTKLMASPTPQSPEGRYGAHWWRKLPEELGGASPAAARLPADALHALGHEGQCLTVIPSRGLTVVRLGLSIDITAWDHAAFLARLLDAA